MIFKPYSGRVEQMGIFKIGQIFNICTHERNLVYGFIIDFRYNKKKHIVVEKWLGCAQTTGHKH